MRPSAESFGTEGDVPTRSMAANAPADPQSSALSQRSDDFHAAGLGGAMAEPGSLPAGGKPNGISSRGSETSPPPTAMDAVAAPGELFAGGAMGAAPESASAKMQSGFRSDPAFDGAGGRGLPPPAAMAAPAAPAALPSNGQAASEPALIVARSEAWNDTDVNRELVKLHINPFGPADLAKDLNSESAQRYALNALGETDSRKQEKLIAPLPESVPINNWFQQIQSIQPLVTVATEDKHSRELFFENSLSKERPEAQSSDAPASTTRAAKSALPGKPGEPDLENKLPARPLGDASSGIILFVTETEAKKVLATVQGLPEGRYWRVIPSGQPTDAPADGDKKVILLLKR